ncbi:MAG: hypothetical protein KKF62_07100 [Bacteroidetes bacterium]|nr:hypothetical protein [Bacteroidota bacterium]MBU1114092.1 hypothetical protein [Bacteroidota bacterium]MBU1800165.1 hypothetical protein [Bacteroidota bacterium]
MKKAIILILMILSASIISQEDKKINPNFYNTWVESNYYEKIMSCKTPYELNSVENSIIELYFFESDNRILFASFYEGIKRNFTIENSDTIKTLDLNGKESTIYLISDNNKTQLVVENREKTLYYIALEKKYYCSSGVQNLLRDMFLAGEYIVDSDSTKKVTFTPGGNVSGISDFNKYQIPIKGIPLPTKYDIVILQKVNKRVENSILLHWEIIKDEIILYNISKSFDDDGNYLEPIILDKYLTLKKLNYKEL